MERATAERAQIERQLPQLQRQAEAAQARLRELTAVRQEAQQQRVARDRWDLGSGALIGVLLGDLLRGGLSRGGFWQRLQEHRVPGQSPWSGGVWNQPGSQEDPWSANPWGDGGGPWGTGGGFGGGGFQTGGTMEGGQSSSGQGGFKHGQFRGRPRQLLKIFWDTNYNLTACCYDPPGGYAYKRSAE